MEIWPCRHLLILQTLLQVDLMQVYAKLPVHLPHLSHDFSLEFSTLGVNLQQNKKIPPISPWKRFSQTESSWKVFLSFNNNTASTLRPLKPHFTSHGKPSYNQHQLYTPIPPTVTSKVHYLPYYQRFSQLFPVPDDRRCSKCLCQLGCPRYYFERILSTCFSINMVFSATLIK